MSCIILASFLERERSPPLHHQDEVEERSDTEESIEGDEGVLGEFTATGEYFPGTLVAIS